MLVSEILRVKGGTLFTVTPQTTLSDAVMTMAEKDIGSLVVMDNGELVGMLTFREVLLTLQRHQGTLGDAQIRSVMDGHPITCAICRCSTARCSPASFRFSMSPRPCSRHRTSRTRCSRPTSVIGRKRPPVKAWRSPHPTA